MLCLAVDASGPVASAAVVAGRGIVAERILVREKAHATELAPMVQGVLRDAGVALRDVDVIACIVGPGSFTGVRIGVALAQGLALGAGKPCCPVNALEALAYPYRHTSATACPLLDARAGQVYGAAFAQGKRLMGDCALPLAQFVHLVDKSGPLLFIGDGARANGEAIRALLGGLAQADDTRVLRASDAALMALDRRDTWVHPAALGPIYLRAPQAERERMAREADAGH